MADFYAVKLGNGNWLDSGGAQDPVNKVATDVQNARIYNSIRSAKMQQTEFIKNRMRFPDNKSFQQKCEVVKLAVSDMEIAVTDKFDGSKPQEEPAPKKYNPNRQSVKPPQQKQKSIQQQPKRQSPQKKSTSLVDLMKRNR